MNVRVTDLEGAKTQAMSSLADLDGNVKWSITEISFWASEDIGSRNGMIPVWNATVTAEGESE
jgi:hypothetical protein